MPASKSSKRNLSSSSSNDGVNKNKIFVSPNRFASLSEDADPHPEVFSPPPVTVSPQAEDTSSHTYMEPPPTTKPHIPPFCVSDGYDFSTLKNSLLKVLDPSSIYFKNTLKYLIIHPRSISAYNAISEYLSNNKQIKFHSYLPKPLRPYSVFIRHLHPSTSVEDIEANITDKGHEVIQVTNILHRINKRALPLFRVDLKLADNNSDIFDIDSLCHTKIKIERPKIKLSPPQCKDCQAYFHTSNYCHHSPRCVKCGDNHPSAICTKPPSSPAKCALCAGPHTASYKGCPVYKNIIQSRKKSKSAINRKLPTPTNPTPSSKNRPVFPNSIHNNRSYANVTANTPPEDSYSISINKFIEEFKTIINPLIILLTSVLNRLQPVTVSVP
ncbi:unnamed protein product [Aphis gossypii]|uniref:Pre-C2HC domain-containing protein n=1 Tax=Aphis gossypii TaxID=80765 RepID=A0A9P0IP43_APHGO|nr:unnamed protein product [Aphis gossypii]